MSAKASTERPRVQRQYECNRLANDFQAQAYEKVFPVQNRPEKGMIAGDRTNVRVAKAEPLEGVAA
jgi:hypothetical protein